MKPYSSARDEFEDFDTADMIFLDANENPFQNGVNRYPDPQQASVKVVLGKMKNVSPKQILLGNGSDEVLDLLFRAFCEPKFDSVITLPPTYGMYGVLANLNNVDNKEVLLTNDFQPQVEKILETVTPTTKIIFLCSPNNPTGNSFSTESVTTLLEKFNGFVVIDEAYIDFSEQQSCTQWLSDFPNLVVTQTFSKAWGLAAIRLGMAFASTEIIGLMNKVKPPYNVNELTQRTALKALKNAEKTAVAIAEILSEREKLADILRGLDFVKKVHPSDANFLLVEVLQPNDLYNWLAINGVVVRNRNNVVLCEGCLRITVGTAAENKALVKAMKEARMYA